MTAALFFTACEDNGGGDENGPGDNEVWMENTAYNPQQLSVDIGATVTWINKDGVDHTVTSGEGLFDSGNISAGGTFEYTFDSAGTYNYGCTIHPDMSGSINVGSSSGNGGNGDDDY